MNKEFELEIINYIIEDLEDVINNSAYEEDVTYRKHILTLAKEKKEELKGDLNMDIKERMAMIDNKVERENAKAEQERIKLENEHKECIAKIRELKPRIDDLIQLANYAKKKGITFKSSGWGGRESYDTGMFYTNSWSHLVGFVDGNEIEYLGIYAGGACGSINFLTDGEDVFGYNTDNKIIVEPKLYHMKKFIKDFDEFESKFYAYIENKCK